MWLDITVSSEIKLPPKIKRRSSPKKAKLTVIGMPKKQKESNKHKPIPFIKNDQ